MLPAETLHALRYLLFGSSYKFDSSQLGIVVNDWRRLRFGIQGAAALEPIFLCSEQQAWSYAAALQGTRLYDSFGTWRESQAGRPQCSRLRHPKSEYGNENRQMAFQEENHRRCHDANARRSQLIAVTLACYKTLEDIMGKPPGSPALRKALNEAGHAVSDRDARWLVTHLPAHDTRAGRPCVPPTATKKESGPVMSRAAPITAVRGNESN